MVYVPGGVYEVGSDEPGEAPRSRVEIDGFYIDRWPVSEAEFRGQANVSTENVEVSPATWMTGDSAEAYAASLGRRLPTEVELEVAARGDDERVYPWGEAWDPTRLDVGATFRPVSKRHPRGASAFGVEDLVGAVFHWTATRVTGANVNATPERRDGDLRVVKAGGWGRVSRYNRATFRTVLGSSWESPFLGFRTVVPLDPDDPNLAATATADYANEWFDLSEATRQLFSYELAPGRRLAPLMEEHLTKDRVGTTVADIGAGIGYLSYRLADQVGREGTVHAVDVDSSVLAFIEDYAAHEGLGQIETRVSEPANIGLPPGSCSEIFLVGTIRLLSPAQWRPFVESCRDALTTDGLLVIEDDNKYPNAASIGPQIASVGFQVVDSWGDAGTWNEGTAQVASGSGLPGSRSRLVVIFRRTGHPPVVEPSGQDR